MEHFACQGMRGVRAAYPQVRARNFSQSDLDTKIDCATILSALLCL